MNTISASSYNAYQTCPNCWRLQYVVGLIQPETDALIIGKAFHKCIELWHEGKKIGEDILYNLKEEMLLEKDDKSIKNFGIVRKMFELYRNNPVAGDTVALELEFKIPLKNIPDQVCLHGFIDRVIDGGIVDYKTSSKDYTLEDINNNIQWDFYSYAYYHLYNEIPEITVYVINKTKLNKPDYKPQTFKFKKTIEEIQDVESKCLDFYHDVVTLGNFEAKPENHQFWSPFKKYCVCSKK